MVVIPDENALLEATFRQAVESNWTLTPFKFITFEEFETQKSNPKQSFLMVLSGKYVKDKAHNEYIYIGLFMGAANNDLNAMPEFMLLPVGGTINESENQYDMFGIFTNVIQQHMRRLKVSPADAKKTLNALYNQNIRSLHGKTLLIAEENLSEPTTQTDMDNLFQGKMELASFDDISDAIDEKAANTVIGYVVYPDSQQTTKGSNCYKMLVSTDGGELYYYKEQKVGGALGLSKRNSGFTKEELKRFSNAYK